MPTIVCDEERIVECLVGFKTAAKWEGWRQEAERRMKITLVEDGCPPETITFYEPDKAVDDDGIPLNAWRLQAIGARPR